MFERVTNDSEIRRLDQMELRSVPRVWPSAECRECGNEYDVRDLPHGLCDQCDNERRGFCACGVEPEPGFAMCGPCLADEAADALFHADR